MRSLLMAGALALLCSAVLAQETVREISWTELDRDGDLKGGEIIPADDQAPFERLRIANRNPQPLTINILTIENPDVRGPAYAILGQVRTTDVEGRGYLEMWNHFPSGGAFFSRTLGDSGPMECLTGTSNWRDFTLPFLIGDKPMEPERLVINVVLPSRGTVDLGPLRLVQYREATGLMASPGQWWGIGGGALVGAIGGALLGCLGALVGVLAARGKAKPVVTGLLRAGVAVGIVMVVAGAVATAVSQPFWVYFPLLLIGFICGVVSLSVNRSVRRRYEELELRKMDSMDAA